MRNRLIPFLLLCATGAAAQIPSITTNSKLRFTEGNTIFDRTVGDIFSTIDIDLTSGVTGVLPVANGGTNISSYTVGDMLYASGATTLSKLAGVATGNALISGGVSTAPSWGKIGLTTHVSGTLGVGNGGTGATTFTAGRLLFGNGGLAIATDANLAWTDASDLLTVTGTEQISIPTTMTATTNGLRIANTVTSATNSITLYGIRNTSTATNDGTPTGNSSFGFYTDNSVSGSTALSNYSGVASVVSNSSANVSQLYGVYGVATESTSSGSLSNRAALRFDMNKATYNADAHTGQGIAVNVQDNSSTGRWSTGYGYNIAVTNALTSYGGRISQSNSRGTGNTQYGLDISQTTSGSGVTSSNVYGINLAHTESSSGAITNYYAIRSASTPAATTNYGLYFSGSGWANYLNGGLSLGVDDATNARLVVRGAGNTSGTAGLLIENSDGTDVFTVRNDQMSAFGTTPVSTERLTVRGSTSDNTAKAFVAERSSGTDVLGVQNDGKVSINNAAYTEELTINGQAQLDGVIFTNVTGSTIASGHMVYTDDATYGGYVTIGDGDRQLAIMPTLIERQAVDYNTNWTTGRTKAFWTVPARFNGWKVSKVYVEVSSIGSGAGDDQVEIEKGGSALSTLTVTAGTHTVTLDNTLATDDIFTFDIIALSATPAKGLNVSLELSKN